MTECHSRSCEIDQSMFTILAALRVAVDACKNIEGWPMLDVGNVERLLTVLSVARELVK